MSPAPRRLLPVLALVCAVSTSVASVAQAAEVSTRSSVVMSLSDPTIVESSGLARSTYARDVLWTHNDSGDGPVVYAVGKDGQTRATVTLGGAQALDWEDIASGPRHRVFVADIGDNAVDRSTVSVYRFREPRELASGELPSTRFDFRYEDGAHDAEALMVNPRTGRVFVVTKAADGAGIYRAPRSLSRDHVNVLRRIAPAPSTVTAGSFYPDANGFVLCNYSTAWIYRDFHHRKARMDKPSLRQGESLEVDRNGTGILMGSEGQDSPVYRVVVG